MHIQRINASSSSSTMRRQYLVQFRLLHVVLVDGIPLSSCTVYRYLCGISLDDISTHKQFAFLVYCYRVNESNFPQSMHSALLASVSDLLHCTLSCGAVYCNRSYLSYLCLWVAGSAKNSSLSQHQSCLSGNWLIFTDERQTERILITQVSLVLVFSVSMQIQTCGE